MCIRFQNTCEHPTATDPCANTSACSDPFVCDVSADQFETVSNADYPCRRNCDLFAIDEYLDQCSAIFPETVEDVTELIEGVRATVQVIQNTNLPVVAALSESNSANIADLAETVSVIEDSSIPDIESEVMALDERLASMETRVRGFETSSAKTPSAQYDQASFEFTSQYAQYKDEMVLVLLASNLSLMVYVACSCKSSRNGKYDEVYLSSEAEEARSENKELL